LGPEPKRTYVLSNPLPHQVRSSTKAAQVARPEFRFQPANLLALQRAAGNRAVAGLFERPPTVQREIGWEGASKEGEAWNAKGGRRDVGGILRLPLDGLDVGLQSKKATYYEQNDKGDWVPKEEGTNIAGLSPESATGTGTKGRAIVLVPKSLTEEGAFGKGKGAIDVVIFLHGHTENTGRPFAGWRALAKGVAKNALRQGLDKDSKDTAPVRDVGLDQAEQQLEESGQQRTIMILPQGGLHSQFGKGGDYSFDSTNFATKIVERLKSEGQLKTGAGASEIIGKVTMAGHSGAGATLSGMAKASVAQMRAGEAPTGLTGDLVLFDAINGQGQFNNFKDYAEERLNADLNELKPPKRKTVDDRIKYLKTAPKLLGYWSAGGGYKIAYTNLQHAINKWFIDNASELEPLGVAGCLHANYSVYNKVEVEHEELMRGVKAGKPREKAGPSGGNAGTILSALKGLHPDYTTCPPLGDLTKPKEMEWPKPKPKANKKPVEEEKKPAAVGPAPAVNRIADKNLPVQRSQTEDLDKGFKAGGKAEVFKLLRQWGSSGPITAESGLAACLDRLFGPDGSSATETDDRWLADKIIASGSEPHWPVDAFKERATRAHDHKWATEAGNIEGSFDAGKGKTSVEAFFFPGTSDRRAMIIGGVHGSEGSGVEVVNDLLADMRQPAAVPPYYSVIVVPVLFPENLKMGFRTTGDKGDDPNRNFPAIGKTLDQARDKKRVPRDSQGRRIEPENVILIDLIERFQPERIASVHGHSEPPSSPVVGKDMPGIFDDPRAGAAEKKADDALALEMAKGASQKGVRVPGNWLGDKKNETSEYPPGAPKMSKGVSLGDYGPKKTDARPAITVVTVEVFGNATSEKSKDGAARKQELESLATVLRDIFLGPPAAPAKQQP
jgi:hypothetical protein